MSAGRAGLLCGQLLRLLERGLFEGTLGQAGSGSGGDLLHAVQIDVEARTLLAESAADNDFAPLLGQGVDLG
jgi:hypothetical protein